MVHVVDDLNRAMCRQRGCGGYTTPVEGSRDDLLTAEYATSVMSELVYAGVGCIKCYNLIDAYHDVHSLIDPVVALQANIGWRDDLPANRGS